MRIALIQMSCPWGQANDNMRRARTWIERAADRHAQMAVFPELSVHGMWKDHLVRLAAEPIEGPVVRTMAGFARRFKIAIGFGLAEQGGLSKVGKPFNSYVLVDRRGQVLGVHRKNCVTVLEREYFRKNSRRPIFLLGNLRVAVGICADCTSNELLDSYGRRGADLVLMPHAWDADPILTNGRVAAWPHIAYMVGAYAGGRVRRYRTHDEMLSVFAKRITAAARRNGYFAAFVNQVGRPHPLMPFVGPTFLVDPNGQLIARSRNEREALVMGDI